MSRALRAVGLFVVLYAGFQLAIDTPAPEFWNGWLRSTAWTTWAALRGIGVDATLDGRFVRSPRFSIEIIRECTALHPLLLYLAAVLAHPCGLRPKVIGAIVGVPVLMALNVVRMVSLFLLGERWPAAVEWAHVVVWQSLLVLAVAVLWIAWSTGPARRDAPARP